MAEEPPLEQSRRTIEAVSYGVSLLVAQLNPDAADGPASNPSRGPAECDGSADAESRARDALFGHIRQLLEFSFGEKGGAATVGAAARQSYSWGGGGGLPGCLLQPRRQRIVRTLFRSRARSAEELFLCLPGAVQICAKWA